MAVISVSSKKQLNFDVLIKTIKNYLSDTPQPNNITENDNFVISEIVREQTIFNTSQELPYAVGVYVESNQYDKITNVLTISAVIVVEKESQKPIIIGKGGQMIKKIGTHARKELLKIFACSINLKLFVKVQKEWRNDERFLKQIGYSN
jgi:GTP-binding protein Era